ncbi:MAG: hypothetical protein HYR55_15660 [Acidobacteria bacterium]|nr:hypothetical protein [Acidobacteriota bacterium]MBI3655966.1 hypothetical protein [Acidobacteriota bacterium]
MFCSKCGVRLDQKSIAELRYIDSLLQRLKEWKKLSLIEAQTADLLLSHYQTRKADLLGQLSLTRQAPRRAELEKLAHILTVIAERKPHAVSAPCDIPRIDNEIRGDDSSAGPAVLDANRSGLHIVCATVDRRPQRNWLAYTLERLRGLSDRLYCFLTARYIWILYGLGAFLLLLSAPAIATQQWTRLPGALRYVFLYAGTVYIFVLSRWLLQKKSWRRVGYVLHFVALLLLPINAFLAGRWDVHRTLHALVSAVFISALSYSYFLLARAVFQHFSRSLATYFALSLVGATAAIMSVTDIHHQFPRGIDFLMIGLGLVFVWGLSFLTVTSLGPWGLRSGLAMWSYVTSLGFAYGWLAYALYSLRATVPIHHMGPLFVLWGGLWFAAQRYVAQARGAGRKPRLWPIMALLVAGQGLAAPDTSSAFAAATLAAATLFLMAFAYDSVPLLNLAYAAALFAYVHLLLLFPGVWQEFYDFAASLYAGNRLLGSASPVVYGLPPLIILLCLRHYFEGRRSMPAFVTGLWATLLSLLVIALAIYDGRLILFLLPGFSLGFLLLAIRTRSRVWIYLLFVTLAVTLCCTMILLQLARSAQYFYGALLGIGYWLLTKACASLWLRRGEAGHTDNASWLYHGIVQSLCNLGLLIAALSWAGLFYEVLFRPLSFYAIAGFLALAGLFCVLSLSLASLLIFAIGFGNGLAFFGLLLYGYRADLGPYGLGLVLVSGGLGLIAYDLAYRRLTSAVCRPIFSAVPADVPALSPAFNVRALVRAGLAMGVLAVLITALTCDHYVKIIILITILMTFGAFIRLAVIFHTTRWFYPALFVLNGGLYANYLMSPTLVNSPWILLGAAYFWWGVSHWLKQRGSGLGEQLGFPDHSLHWPFFNVSYALTALVISTSLLPLLGGFTPDFSPLRMLSILPYAVFFLLQVKTHSERTWLYGFLMIVTAPFLIGAGFRFPKHPASMIYLLSLVNLWLLTYNLIKKHREKLCRLLNVQPDHYEVPFYHCAVIVLLVILVQFFRDITIQTTDPYDLRLRLLAVSILATALLAGTYLHLVFLKPTEFFINCFIFTFIAGVFWQSQLIYFEFIGPGFYYPGLEIALLAVLVLIAFIQARRGGFFKLYGLRGRIQLGPNEKASLEKLLAYWIVVIAFFSFVLNGIDNIQHQPPPQSVKRPIHEIVAKNIRHFLGQTTVTETGLSHDEKENAVPLPEGRTNPRALIAFIITTSVLAALAGLRPTRIIIIGALVSILYCGYSALAYVWLTAPTGGLHYPLLTLFALWTSLISCVITILPGFGYSAKLREYPVIGRVSDAFRHVALVECLIPVADTVPLDPPYQGAIVLTFALMIIQSLARAHETQRASKVYFAGAVLAGLAAYIHAQLEGRVLSSEAFAIIYLGLALAFFIGQALLRRTYYAIFAQPLFRMAALLPLLTWAEVAHSSVPARIGLSLASGAFYLVMYRYARLGLLASAAGATINYGLFFGWLYLGVISVPAYVFPPALSVLALAQLHGSRISRDLRHWLRCIGCALLGLSTLGQILWNGSAAHHWLLAAICAAGIWSGIRWQVRAYFFSGLFFLFLGTIVIALRSWDQPSVYLMALMGIGLIITAALLGHRHDAIAMRWRTLIKQWE